ncbi:MAG: tRNA adenosine(34) deaminase TadA [Anaerolineae bacterium]|nr:tRNA adenosine(34) deaminase TadA [Gemmatimonadaceae bacterium]
MSKHVITSKATSVPVQNQYFSSADEAGIRAALEMARGGELAGEVPVGAVVVRAGEIVASASNRTLRDQDATAHAEILALRAAAARIRSWRLQDCTLYVTLEPCAMCAGAIVLTRTARVIFGAWDDKAGMAGSVGDLLRHPRLNHRPEVRGGVCAKECAELLSDFFRARRNSVDSPSEGD